MDEKKPRTLRQNRSLHKWFSLVAETLNEKGLDIKTTLSSEMDIPWTPVTVKELLWRPSQQIMFQKESTTELTTKELNEVVEVINRYLAGLGIHGPFPSVSALMYNDGYENHRELYT